MKKKMKYWGVPACLAWIITRDAKSCEKIDQTENIGDDLALAVVMGCNGINLDRFTTSIPQAKKQLYAQLRAGHLASFAVPENGDRRSIEPIEWKGRYLKSQNNGFYVGFLAAPTTQSALTTALKDIQIVVADIVRQWPRLGIATRTRTTGPKTGKTDKIYNHIKAALDNGSLTHEAYYKIKNKEFLSVDCRSLDTVRKARARVKADLEYAGITNSGK
jgi:hypothetical protein